MIRNESKSGCGTGWGGGGSCNGWGGGGCCNGWRGSVGGSLNGSRYEDHILHNRALAPAQVLAYASKNSMLATLFDSHSYNTYIHRREFVLTSSKANGARFRRNIFRLLGLTCQKRLSCNWTVVPFAASRAPHKKDSAVVRL